MRIVIAGVGAMGSLFGGKLSAEAKVTLLDPWAEHVDAMQRDGLCITELDGSETTVPVTATTDSSAVPKVDLVIIFVKARATKQASQWASDFLASDGLALTLQNGIGNAEMMAEILGAERVVAGVTLHGATLLGPGRVRHAGFGPTYIITRPEIAHKLATMAKVFERAGFEVHLSDDLESLIWGKLIVNVGINALTGILRVPNGQLVESLAAGKLMAQAVAEAVAVCQAKGIILPYNDPLNRAREVARATATNRASMLQDVLRGVPTEINVINEVIVREGERLGVPTPVNEFIVTTIRAIEDSYKVRVS